MALTPQEIEAARKQIGFTPSSSIESSGAANVARLRALAEQYDAQQEAQKSYPQKVVGNLKDTFTQGAEKIQQDVVQARETADRISPAGNNPGVVEKVLASGKAAGNIAGDVATTAGGLLGSFIEPILSDNIKSKLGNAVSFIDEKVKSIPGMTPEIQQALGDVFNTISLKGGNKAATAGKEIAGQAAIKTGEIAKNSIDDIAQGARSLVDKAPQLRKVGENKIVKWLASEPDDQVKTILQETPTSKFDKYLKIAEEASVDPRKSSVFETVGDELTRATKRLKSQANSIGAQKSAILEKAKTGLQPFVDAPRKAIIKVMKLSDNPLKNKIIEKLKSVKTKVDADKVIDEIQGMIYDAKGTNLIAEGSAIERQIQGVIGEMNEALKTSLPESYRGLNAKYADRIKIVNTLNRALGEVVDGVPTRGASLIKQFFSPAGSKTKELFEFIKKNTGVDLAQDTTVAKFFGEVFDDPKVKSLLENLPTSKGGLIDRAIDFAAEKSGLMKEVKKSVRGATLQKAKDLTR